LGKKKTLRVLNGSAMSLLCGGDARIGYIEKILEVLCSVELVQMWEKRARVEVLKSLLEKKGL